MVRAANHLTGAECAIVNNSDTYQPMKLFFRLILATIAIILCVAAAAMLPGLWPGISGRDFRPQAINASIMIGVVAFLLRYRRQWPLAHMLFGLIPSQVIILLVSGYFSGYTGTELLNDFNLCWLVQIDIFICSPWLIGTIVGSLMLRRQAR